MTYKLTPEWQAEQDQSSQRTALREFCDRWTLTEPTEKQLAEATAELKAYIAKRQARAGGTS